MANVTTTEPASDMKHSTRLRADLPIAMLMAGLFVGCATTPTVPAPSTTTTDTTPALLRLGSAGLRKDILVDQDSTGPDQRRARRNDEILFVATARDPETGIRSVTLDVTESTICGSTGTHRTFSETRSAPAGTGNLPVELAKSYLVKMGPKRAACQSSPSSVDLSIIVSAENGLGNVTVLPPARIASFGPDTLRVATFNLAGIANHTDATYQRWGQQLGSKADVVMLTEVIDQRRAELFATAAGMAYAVKMTDGDVAIASRSPLYDIAAQVIDPPGRLSSNNSNILGAQSDLGGFPHRFIVGHWGIRDANDVPMGPDVSSPSRLLAAQAMVGMTAASLRPAFAGGDLNAYSGVGPQDHDGVAVTPDVVGSTSEIDFLRTRFSDPFIRMNLGNGDHCSNQRIDYIMSSGPYVPVKYETCFDATPSDHPFVLITFEAGDQ